MFTTLDKQELVLIATNLIILLIQCCFNCNQSGHFSSSCPRPVICNLCKSVDPKANVSPFSWACDPTGNAPPREGVVSVADPVLTDDDMFKDDNEEEDENEEQNLHVTFDTDDAFVAAPGIPLSTQHSVTPILRAMTFSRKKWTRTRRKLLRILQIYSC